MKNVFFKITALFFLSILLASSVLNLHVYFHDHEHDHYVGNFDEHHDEDEDDAPCELCLLVLNLNNLDYNNTLEFSYESDTQIITYNRKEVLNYSKSHYNQLFSDHNRNKAPPRFI